VFSGALAVHALALFLVGTQGSRPAPSVRRETVIPIEFAAPGIRPTKPPPKPSADPKPPAPPRQAAPAHSVIPLLTPPPPEPAPAVEASAPAPAAGGAPDGTGPGGAAAEAPPEPLGKPAGGLGEGGPSQKDYPINPGYWKVTSRWLLLEQTDRYCVTPLNITRFMGGPCNHRYTCVYPVEEWAGGRLRIQGEIWRKGERYKVTGSGAYAPDRLHVSLRGAGHWNLMPVAFLAWVDGEFLGADCPPDAKPIRQR